MKEYDLISAEDASVNVTSVELDLGDLTKYSIEVTFSGATLGGDLKLQASNTAQNWIDVDGSEQTVASSAGHMWDISDAGYRYVRVDWVNSAGTGTMTAKALIKENVTKKS